MVGIIAAGAYVPRMRLQRAAIARAHEWWAPELTAMSRGERAISSWDEDPVTMAVEAARDCLHERDRDRVQRVVVASTSHPFLDRQNAGIVKEALNLPDGVATLDIGGSQRAGTSALLNALYASQGGAGAILCIGAEKRRVQPASALEMTAADAASAFLIGTGEVALEFVGGHTVSIDFVDHFRTSEHEFDYFWETRWIRDEGYAKIVPEAVRATLGKLALKASDIGRFVMAAPIKGVHLDVARLLGLPAQKVADPLSDRLGDAGTAQPLVLLTHVLEQAKPGELIVVVGFGQGCDVLVFRATEKVGAAISGLGVAGWLARRKEETNYLRYLVLNGLVPVERGMRAEFDQKVPLTALYRNRKAVFALVGGKCAKTGLVQFPKSEIGISPDRAIGTQEDYPLAERRAVIVTHTADRLTYSPDPPNYYGVIDFEGGGRMTTEFVDIDESDLQVGAAVRMVFRVKYRDERRGFFRYFWKATADFRK